MFFGETKPSFTDGTLSCSFIENISQLGCFRNRAGPATLVLQTLTCFLPEQNLSVTFLVQLHLKNCTNDKKLTQIIWGVEEGNMVFFFYLCGKRKFTCSLCMQFRFTISAGWYVHDPLYNPAFHLLTFALYLTAEMILYIKFISPLFSLVASVC